LPVSPVAADCSAKAICRVAAVMGEVRLFFT
jgi:hypothetical protein